MEVKSLKKHRKAPIDVRIHAQLQMAKESILFKKRIYFHNIWAVTVRYLTGPANLGNNRMEQYYLSRSDAGAVLRQPWKSHCRRH